MRPPPPPSASASISAQRAALSANPARACRGVQCARLSCRGTFRCGAVSLIHLERPLRMCVKIAAMVRALPGGLALLAVGSRCSIRIWFMRSLAAKIWTGVGVQTALAFQTFVGDVERFASAKKVASYFGLAPGE